MSWNKDLSGAVTTSGGGVVTAFGVLAAKSVLANSTNASAVPAALAGSAAFQHLRLNSANTGLEWSVLTTGDFPANSVPLTAFPTISADSFFVNGTGGAAIPTAIAGATVAGGGLTYTTGGILAVGAGTGLTVNANDVQVSAITAKSVFANATNGSAVPSALAGSAAFQHLRVNSANNALEWSVLTTGDFPSNSVPVTALATIAAKSVLANATNATATPTAVASSGALQYLRVNSGNTGLEWATGTSLPWTTATEATAGPFNDYAIPDLSTTGFTLLITSTTDVVFTGFAASGGNVQGYRFSIQTTNSTSCRLRLNSNDAASVAANRVTTPEDEDIIIRNRAMVELEYRNNGWRVILPNSVFENKATNADKDRVIHNGTNFVTTNALRKSRNRCEWWDDFEAIDTGIEPSTTGNAVSFGSTAWFVQHGGGAINGASSLDNINGEAGHPGILRLGTGATSGNQVSIFRGSDTNFSWVMGQEILEFEVVARQVVPAASGFFIGFSENPTLLTITGTTNSHICGFLFDTAGVLTDTTIHCITRESDGTATNTDSNVVPSGWQTFTIRQDVVGTITFLIDDVLVATHSTTVPDVETMNCGITVVTRFAGNAQIDIDYVSFTSQELDRTV